MGQQLEIRRAGREDLTAIASLVGEATRLNVSVGETEVRDWLFSKGLWLAFCDDMLVGVAAWQVENLVSVTELFLASSGPWWAEAGRSLLETIETEAGTLMCEVNVVPFPGWVPDNVRTLLQEQGYESRSLEELHRFWQEVLSDFCVHELDLMVKRLRDQMVMVPV